MELGDADHQRVLRVDVAAGDGLQRHHHVGPDHDRVDALVELDQPAAVPPQAGRHEPREAAFQPTPGLPSVVLRVGRCGRWITEYYPCEDVRVEPNGEWLVTMRVTDLAWARRFVLGLGPDVTVVAPAQLVAQVHAAASAALAAYAVPGGAPAADLSASG